MAEYAERRDAAEVARCGERWKTERTEAAKEDLLGRGALGVGERRGEGEGGR